MANLGPQKQSTSYLGLLQVPDGLTTVLKNITDGLGASSPLQLSTTSIGFSSLTMTGPINMGGYQINNLGAPSFSTDAATKAYVDSIATGLQPKTQCFAGTVSDITLSGEQTIDDVSVVAGDRVLVKNQAIQANNGIYIVSASAWTRSSDADTWAEIAGAYVFVVSGTVNAATSWVCNSPANGTLGSTAITWIKFSSSTSTLANYLTFDAQGDGDQGYTDIATENGYNILAESGDYLTIQTPGTIQFNGSSPVLISYNSIGAIALDGSNVSPGSTWNIDITGNAGSVTNGVYTSGSYLDPAWITGLASTKLIGAVPVNLGGTGASSLSGILLGNGISPVSTATAADIVSTIGSTPVANATNAVNATNATNASTALVATTTTQTNFSNLTINGSQVLDAANYSSYVGQTYVDVASQYGPSYGGKTSAAIQAAINANPGRTIYLRGGPTNPTDYWAISSTVTITRGCTLVGDGVFTLLYPSGLTNAPMIDIETTEQVCIDNMQILGNNAAGIVGIKVSGGSGAENQNSRFSRLDVYACSTGINFYSAYKWTFVDSIIHSCTYGMYVQEVIDPDHGDCAVIGCEFESNTYAIYQVALGDLRIIGNKFIGGVDHWHVEPNGNPINDAIFQGNSSENASGAHVYLNGTNGVINNVVVSGNQIALADDKSNITGILLTGDGIDSPVQTNIMGNVIWVRHANQTGIGVTAGGYDGNCYNTIYIANNNLYSQNGPTGQVAIALQNIASVRCGVNNIAWNLSNTASNWASRYVITTSQTCQFDVGQAQSGAGSYSGGYGSYGNVFIGGPITVTFGNKFPSNPSVNVVLDNPGSGSSGGIGYLIRNVTNSSFDMYVITAGSSGTVYYAWNAYVTGQ